MLPLLAGHRRDLDEIFDPHGWGEDGVSDSDLVALVDESMRDAARDEQDVAGRAGPGPAVDNYIAVTGQHENCQIVFGVQVIWLTITDSHEVVRGIFRAAQIDLVHVRPGWHRMLAEFSRPVVQVDWVDPGTLRRGPTTADDADSECEDQEEVGAGPVHVCLAEVLVKSWSKIVAAMQSATEATLNETDGLGNRQSLDNFTDAVTVSVGSV